MSQNVKQKSTLNAHNTSVTTTQFSRRAAGSASCSSGLGYSWFLNAAPLSEAPCGHRWPPLAAPGAGAASREPSLASAPWDASSLVNIPPTRDARRHTASLALTGEKGVRPGCVSRSCFIWSGAVLRESRPGRRGEWAAGSANTRARPGVASLLGGTCEGYSLARC